MWLLHSYLLFVIIFFCMYNLFFQKCYQVFVYKFTSPLIKGLSIYMKKSNHSLLGEDFNPFSWYFRFSFSKGRSRSSTTNKDVQKWRKDSFYSRVCHDQGKQSKQSPWIWRPVLFLGQNIYKLDLLMSSFFRFHTI